MGFPPIITVIDAPAVVEWNGKRYYLKVRDLYYRCSGGSQLHRDMWQLAYGAIPKGFEVHHKDENKLHNDLVNFELQERGKHRSGHNKRKPRGFIVDGHASAAKAMWDKRKPVKRVCIICGEGYESLATYSSYCGDACRATARYTGVAGLHNVPRH